ncbi:hypothetical protein KCP71_19480 [Salmonella enterica subsp. enterica]|nr:hypothetical protein KCP71_19480 [Salmonella enterica subsp. enterica]
MQGCDWHFTAVRRDNGRAQHTTGRESGVGEYQTQDGESFMSTLLPGPAKRRWRRLQ